MTMYKSREITVYIKASEVNKGDTGIRFYTEDEQTASIQIRIRNKDGSYYNLTASKLVPKLSLFAEDGSIWLDQPAKIVDGENGLIQYDIPQNIIKHSGKMRVKLFLIGENDTGMHVANFEFKIIDSGIEDAIAKEIDVKLLDNTILRLMSENPEKFKGKNAYEIWLEMGNVGSEEEFFKKVVDTSTLASKIHTHTIGDITNLQISLDTKANKSDVQGYKIFSDDGKAIYVAGLDFNAPLMLAPRSGFYYVANGTNQPTGESGNGYLKLVKYNDTYVYMEFAPLYKNTLYARYITGGTVGAWVKIATSGDLATFQASIDNKADKTHTHSIADVTGLQTALDSKSDKTYVDNTFMKKTDQASVDLTAYQKTTDADNKYASKTHAHTTSQITDFTTDVNSVVDAYVNANITKLKGADGLNGTSPSPAEVAPLLQTTVTNQVKTEFSKLSTAVQQDAEVIDARSGFTSLDTRLNLNDQVDFVEKLESITGTYGKMAVFIENAPTKTMKIVQPISPTRAIAHWFYKNAKDDYIIELQSELGDYTFEPRNVSFQNLTMDDPMKFNTVYPPNYYATTKGATLSGTIVADKVNFVHYKSNAGGLWEAILDEGTVNEKRTTISTYNPTAMAEQEAVLFDNLEWKSHTIKLVYQGQDPSNPVASPRGWFYYGGARPADVKGTISINRLVPIISNVKKQMYSMSNKEFAFQIKAAGATTSEQFVPEHNSIGTAFKTRDEIALCDGKAIEWIGGKTYADISTFQLIQDVNGRVDGVDLINITTSHTIKNGTVYQSGTMRTLKDTYFKTGYVGMIPYFADNVSEVKSSLKNRYAPDVSGTYRIETIPEDLRTKSYLLTTQLNNMVTAFTFDDFVSTMRLEENNAKGDTWIEHRNALLGKVYNQQLKEETLKMGSEFSWRFRLRTHELALANKLI